MKTDNKNTWCVYIHTNKINNKAYIGVTSKRPEKRWGENGNRYSHNPALQNAIDKYGWDNFNHIIFMSNLSEQKAKHIEILLIALFQTNCKRFYTPSYGYNMTDGGDETPHNTRCVYQYDLNGEFVKCWESITIAGESLNINKSSIIRCCGQYVKSAGGFIWSYEKKDKLDEYDSQREKVIILQYSKDGNLINKFNSLSEASEVTGVPVSNICNCYKHNKRSAGGFI